MTKTMIGIAIAFAAATAVPTAAQAQEANGRVHPYVGVQVGLHDLGVDEDDFAPIDIDDNGIIYGGYLGVDFAIGSNAVIGIEGNFNLGSSTIDSEYGAAARIGYRTANGTVIYVRGGYQWIDIDVETLVGGLPIPPGTEDSDDDYLVGVGADIAIGNGPVRIRLGVDTISFDSLRATTGLNLTF